MRRAAPASWGCRRAPGRRLAGEGRDGPGGRRALARSLGPFRYSHSFPFATRHSPANAAPARETAKAEPASRKGIRGRRSSDDTQEAPRPRPRPVIFACCLFPLATTAERWGLTDDLTTCKPLRRRSPHAARRAAQHAGGTKSTRSSGPQHATDGPHRSKSAAGDGPTAGRVVRTQGNDAQPRGRAPGAARGEGEGARTTPLQKPDRLARGRGTAATAAAAAMARLLGGRRGAAEGR